MNKVCIFDANFNRTQMKRTGFMVAAFLLLATMAFGQANQVVGFWLTAEGDSQVEITRKSDNNYYGRIVWLKDPLNDNGRPKVDDKNPDKSKHNTPILGLELLKGFAYNSSKKEWANGTIYDPNNGKTYDCYMWLDGNNTLKIKGFVLGMRFLGRETTWTRERAKRE
jgi:uncharacterized protein (DUF2147 family)